MAAEQKPMQLIENVGSRHRLPDNETGGSRTKFMWLFGAALLISLALIGGAAQARFRQPSEEYQARRAKLRAAVDGPIVIFGYTGHEDASEVAVFFQEPSFYYLTGHDEPGAALLLIPDAAAGAPANGPREILYLPPRDLKKKFGKGRRSARTIRK